LEVENLISKQGMTLLPSQCLFLQCCHETTERNPNICMRR
jgi:hypothetical protein